MGEILEIGQYLELKWSPNHGWGLIGSVLLSLLQWKNKISTFLFFGGSGSKLPYLGILGRNHVLGYILA